MASERDEGLAALQRGAFDTAATLLESACRQTPDDFWAHLYLGGAYHQLHRNEEAIRTLTRAVELQPGNAQARYNLAIALEKAGRKAEALTSVQSALALQPDYPLAQQAQQRLQPTSSPSTPASPIPPSFFSPEANGPLQKSVPGASSGPFQLDDLPTEMPIAPPPVAPQAPALNDYDAGRTLQGAPPPQNTAPAPGYNPLPPPPPGPNTGYGQPAPQPDYAGQPTLYGQPTQPIGYGAPPGYGRPALPNAQHPALYAPPYGAPGYSYAPGPSGAPTWSEDSFSLGQAFYDWLQILIAPLSFFRDQQDCEGFLAPFSMTMAYILVIGAASTLTGFMLIGPFMLIAVFFLAFYLVLTYALNVAGNMLFAGMLHGIGKLFGNVASFAGSFRATVYSQAPVMALCSLMILLAPLLRPTSTPTATAHAPARIMTVQYSPPSSDGASGDAYRSPNAQDDQSSRHRFPGDGSSRSNPFSSQEPSPFLGLFFFIACLGGIWNLILQGIAVHFIQKVPVGGAVGTVLISFGIVFAIGVFLIIAGANAVLGAMH